MSPARTSAAPTAKRRNRRGEETRAQIIGAAISCLTRLGYAGTSIEAVMAEAGLSRGSVLHAFATRTALMVATSEAAMQAMIAETRQRMASIRDPAERYRRMCDITWDVQNLPEGAAVTEVLLAARWDAALARGLREVARRIEDEIDLYTAEVATAAGVKARDLDSCLLAGRIRILSLRGIALELGFDSDRKMINRALGQIRAQHAAHCDAVLG